MSKKPKVLDKMKNKKHFWQHWMHTLRNWKQKTEWKFRQNIIKRNKKKSTKKTKQTKIQSVFAVLFNCKPVKIKFVTFACTPASIWQVCFLGARCPALASLSTLSTVTRLHLYSPSSVSFKKQWSVVHNYSALLFFK